ncbi:hypothetical protein, partial [Archaeoglobus sp.]
ACKTSLFKAGIRKRVGGSFKYLGGYTKHWNVSDDLTREELRQIARRITSPSGWGCREPALNSRMKSR